MPYSVAQWAKLGANATGTPPDTTGDALQRRSMVSVVLPFLRGGVLPTGSDLDTARERQYADGLYVRAPAVGADLDLSVAESLTVVDVASPFLPPTGGEVLVPVLIPSYRRRRMV